MLLERYQRRATAIVDDAPRTADFTPMLHARLNESDLSGDTPAQAVLCRRRRCSPCHQTSAYGRISARNDHADFAWCARCQTSSAMSFGWQK